MQTSRRNLVLLIGLLAGLARPAGAQDLAPLEGRTTLKVLDDGIDGLGLPAAGED